MIAFQLRGPTRLDVLILTEPHPVPPALHQHRRRLLRRPLLALLAICLALGFGMPATASGSAFSVASNTSEVKTPHHCACKSCTGDSSCCCAKREVDESPRKSASTPASQSSKSPTTGPCFNAAPCGDGDGLPPNRPGSPVSKATLSESIVIRLECPPLVLLHFPEPFVPASFEDRIDDPPEPSQRP